MTQNNLNSIVLFIKLASEVIIYYLQMRMHQYTYQKNLKFQKVVGEKEKIAKLYNS
jgi:hypothetical protein